MDDPKQSPRPARLEEALHPRIGNAAGFADGSHESQLRTVDPLKALDPKLLDERQVADIADQWQADLDKRESDLVSALSADPVIEEETAALQAESPLLVPEEIAATENPPAVAPKKSKSKVGKRVKKVARKEAEKVEQVDREIRTRFSTSRDEQLTPFTRWLKGLKGSEYVHPYDDDFAFFQAEGPAREGISETYADLLATQGYKEQAIEMYRRLMERFPEKSRFFAAKIEALQ